MDHEVWDIYREECIKKNGSVAEEMDTRARAKSIGEYLKSLSNIAGDGRNYNDKARVWAAKRIIIYGPALAINAATGRNFDNQARNYVRKMLAEADVGSDDLKSLLAEARRQCGFEPV